MSSRLITNLVLAATVLALASVLLFKPEPAGPPQFHLSTLTPQTVTRIELTPRDGPAIVLARKAAGWRLAAPFSARADEARVEALLGLLASRSEQRLPARELQKFGLAPPYARLTIDTAASRQVFDFGDRQPVSDQVYVLTGGWVYLVSPVYLVDVSRGAMDFVAKNPLAEEEKPVGFSLPRLRLSLENGRWRREPDNGRLSADSLNRFLDEWRLARAVSVQQAGRAPAQSRASVHLADGRVLVFSLIAREPEWILRREDEGLEYHFAPDAGARLIDPARAEAAP
ncbi:DUF4340 domain-containing protein [Thiobacter aerophilum]|uniref:DUF4340 domain-containing protein n=1 Tax=Thiobacter aerophilum TaxID=3121275 RepID=A0ABV0EG49_9BURK